MKDTTRSIVLILCLFLLCSATSLTQPSQGREKFSRPPREGASMKIFSSSSFQKPYDVVHYSLDVFPAMVNGGFHGTTVITASITDVTDSLWFHALGLIIDTLTVNDTAASVRVDSLNERFILGLPRTFVPPETVSVRIVYERDIAFPRLVERQGYYWYPKGYLLGVLENIGYTMSEPRDARLWMPCYDEPSEKATCEINAHVPAGYLAASNGILTGVESSDTISVFHWKENLPVATYLMCVTVSRYSTFSHYYHKVTNPADSLEVKYYIWRADSAGAQYNAVQAFSKVTEMMRIYSLIFGEYPFEKYGMTAVYPFQFGGMEHQTITTIHRGWLSAPAYPHNENYIAHELAHQWWGDMVTCETFKDIWLNESFATYAEALWQEGEYGSLAYSNLMKNFQFFDPTWQAAIYDPEGQGQPLFGSAEYEKGAWVLHMLRAIVGDSLFFHVLENYRAARYMSTANTPQLSAIVNATTGSDYSWFFSEWIYGPGWPTYTFRTVWDTASVKYNLQVMQLQSAYPLFKMPIEVDVWYQGLDSTYILWDSLGTQSFPLQANIDSVQFDPRNRVLKKTQMWPTAVDDQRGLPTQTVLLQNFPNPFNPSTTIRYTLSNRQLVSLKLYDMLGREVRTLASGMQEPGVRSVNVDAGNLPSGVYLYRLQTTGSTVTRKMIIVR